MRSNLSNVDHRQPSIYVNRKTNIKKTRRARQRSIPNKSKSKESKAKKVKINVQTNGKNDLILFFTRDIEIFFALLHIFFILSTCIFKHCNSIVLLFYNDLHKYGYNTVQRKWQQQKEKRKKIWNNMKRKQTNNSTVRFTNRLGIEGEKTEAFGKK